LHFVVESRARNFEAHAFLQSESPSGPSSRYTFVIF
jgi:hypothetical protein